MTIYFYKRLTRNSEIGNTVVWVLPNIYRIGHVKDTKSGIDVFDKMLLNAAKCEGYTIFELLKGNQQGVYGKNTPIPDPN